MKKLLSLALLLAASISHATPVVDPSQVHEHSSSSRNYVKNPSARKGKSGVTTSSATAAQVTTSGNKLDGFSSWTCDSSATGGYCEFSLDTIEDGDKTGTCEFSGKINGDGSLYAAQLLDGSSNLLNSAVLSNTSDWTDFGPIIYPCGSSRKIRITQVSAGTAPALGVGRLYYGRATGVGTIAQPQHLGSVRWSTTTGCTWTSNNASWSNFASDNDCDDNARTVTGSGVTDVSAGLRPAIGVVNPGAGRYVVTYRGSLYKNATTNTRCDYRFSDGTNSSQPGAVTGSSSEVQAPTFTGEFNYATAPSSLTFDLQTYALTVINCMVDASTIGSELSVVYYPLETSTTLRANTTNWRVDANISGANPSLGTVDASTYSAPESSSLTLTNNSGTNTITAMIPCSGTNAPTGTTCSSGNESVGVSFNDPVAGDVEACVAFAHQFQGTNVGQNVLATFQIVETASNSQTILQEGKSRLQSQIANEASNTVTQSNPMTVCGTFYFPSAGQKTLRLMFETDVTGTPGINAIIGDADSLAGQRDIHWTVRPINQSISTPVIIGGKPTVQKFTSGTSQTYTTPAGVRYIRVRAVGGGGGGGGSSTTSASNGGTGGSGGSTTFGTSGIVCGGGSGGAKGANGSGAGGTSSLGSIGAIGTAFAGSSGQSGAQAYSGGGDGTSPGGLGGNSPFGGAGSYVVNVIPNTGSGGGGASSPGAGVSGSGGGAGGYVDAIITSPNSTYTYTVGSGGTAGSAGTSGGAGGAGAAGYIEVTEYYQ